MSKPVLLSSYLSSCAWRVRIVLEVKKIDFEYRTVDLRPGNGEQRTEKFKAMNPMGQVPVLLVDGKPISQSVAIMEYLEEKYPEPKDAACRPLPESQVSRGCRASRFRSSAYADRCPDLCPWQGGMEEVGRPHHHSWFCRSGSHLCGDSRQQHPLVKKADPSCQPDTPPTGVPNVADLFKGPGDK
ncbi:hypothetical protein MTO96_025224 [Rhipicephalus appendiculatus]